MEATKIQIPTDTRFDILHAYHRQEFVFKNHLGNIVRRGIPEGFYKNAVSFDGFTFAGPELSCVGVNVKHIKQLPGYIEHAREIVNIICGTQFIEPHEIGAKYQPTVKDHLNILVIDFKAYQVIKHRDDKPIQITLHFTNWGSVNTFIWGKEGGNEQGTNNKGYLIYQKLLQLGYGLPWNEYSAEQLADENIYQFEKT